MQRKLLPVILLGLILLGAAAALADGDFYSAGPWGAKITSLPCTITAPGCYYLGSNLSYAGGNGITVNSDDVTLDLMGFTITGPGSANTGIFMSSRKNVEIRNGTLSGWLYGIRDNSSGAAGHRVTNVRAEGNSVGICLNGSGHLIQGCRATAAGTGDSGLYIQSQGTISGCQTNNFLYGIAIDNYGTITGNVVIGPGGTSGNGGIYTGASSLVMGNEVTNARIGIDCTGAASIIGNTVSTSAGQTGIQVSTTDPTVLDQNSVTGSGTHYLGITLGVTFTRYNAGYP